jgi:DNA modification methylase
MNDYTLHVGDVRDILPTLETGSVDCVATSPPFYALRDYGVDDQIGLEATSDAWAAELVAVFRECRRVLADHGTLWVECGDSYAQYDGQGNKDDPRKPGLHGSFKVSGRLSEVAEGRSDRHSLPTGYKRKDLLGSPWLLAFALRADGWYLRQAIIWHKPNCLSGGTRLYARTQKGVASAMLKDLVRLDPATVELWNGTKWTRVVSWTPNPRREDVLEVEVRSGESVGCTPDHLWPTQRGNVRADELRVGDVIPTVTFPDTLSAEPAHAPDSLGWLVGHYLAEGSRSGTALQISCHADELEEVYRLWHEAAAAYDGRARHHVYGNTAVVIVECRPLAALIDEYVHRGTARTKRLRRKAWQRSNSFLRALLDGYLYGDGHYEAKNDRWRLGFTRNDELASDLRCLGARLGATVVLRKTFARRDDQRWPSYRGELRFTRRAHHNACPLGEVVAVRRSRGRKFWDVTVADEPHTFALASGLLTHNCIPESVRDRCTAAHSYVFLFSKKPRYWFDAEAISEPAEWARWGDQTTPKYNGTPTAAGWIQPKSKTELRHKASADVLATGTWDSRDLASGKSHPDGRSVGGPAEGATKNARSVWTIPTQGYPGAHFATWPEALVDRIVKAGCPEAVCQTCGKPRERLQTLEEPPEEYTPRASPAFQTRRFASATGGYTRGRETVGWRDCGHDNYRPGRILDPFGGTGTTAVVARRLGRRGVLVELSEEYAEIARERLAEWWKPPARASSPETLDGQLDILTMLRTEG